MSHKNKTLRRNRVRSPSHRYNRRHDGVLTVTSDKDRHELEEDRLRKQWEKTVVKSAVPVTSATPVTPLTPTTTTPTTPVTPTTPITSVTLRPGKEVFRG